MTISGYTHTLDIKMQYCKKLHFNTEKLFQHSIWGAYLLCCIRTRIKI